MPLFVYSSCLFCDGAVAHTNKLGRLILVEYIDALFDCAEYDVRMVDTH